MKQVLQLLDAGETRVRDVPAPVCAPREVLIMNAASLVSAGTERAVVTLAKQSWLMKALQRPDQVRRVLQKCRQEGVLDTLRQVRARLDDPLALGYSSAGIVVEVGREVARFRPGDRVASNGPHAELVAVPHTLVARLPGEISFEEGAFAAVGAVALQGIRLAGAGLGDRVAIIGLGLVGQIAAMLLRAAGCRVLATDLLDWRVRLAAEAGCEVAGPGGFQDFVRQTSEGRGVDAVIITAAADDNAALELAVAVARKKARVIVVGAVGLDVPRRDFYLKELELVVSCSYGPGRYDRDYEEGGRDYPLAYVRWTAQRNMEAVLDQIARGPLAVKRLVTHRFAIEDAPLAYRLIEHGAEPSLGIVLRYPLDSDRQRASRRMELSTAVAAPRRAGTRLGIALVGAGTFGAGILAPALLRAPGVRPRMICSARGVRAAAAGERLGFEVAGTAFEDVLADRDVDAVFLATPHHLHAEQALAALQAGKAVFVEKPLAISRDQLAQFQHGLAGLGAQAPLWTVGFNRRFAPTTRLVAQFFADVGEPCALIYRFNAGPLASDHWIHDPGVGGGRLVAEACHALDLASALLRGQIVRVFAGAIASADENRSGDDQAAIVAQLDNGSVASVAYSGGGDRAFSKERIELLGGGRIAVIDDFRRVTLSAGGRLRRRRLWRRDKGHRATLAAFVDAARTGVPPIPYAALLNASWAVIAVVDSLKTGEPVDVPVF